MEYICSRTIIYNLIFFYVLYYCFIKFLTIKSTTIKRNESIQYHLLIKNLNNYIIYND